MTRKQEKIKNNIVLSIRYARLKEEASDTEQKKLELADKKNFLGSKEKKIDKSNQFIASVNLAIRKIEQNNATGAYSLGVEDKMSAMLKVLSKNKNFELIKYGIAVEVIMDDSFLYTENTNVDFLEKISVLLFDNENAIKKIEDDYKRIATAIYGTGFKNHLEETANMFMHMPIKDLAKKFVRIPKTALTFLGAAAIGVGLGFTYRKLRKQAKSMSTLGPGDFANKLIISALNLLYAENHFKSEVQYCNYFKSVLTEINLERKFIMKEMFEEQKEQEENKWKIKLLHNYDNYLIAQIESIQKKRNK